MDVHLKVSSKAGKRLGTLAISHEHNSKSNTTTFGWWWFGPTMGPKKGPCDWEFDPNNGAFSLGLETPDSDIPLLFGRLDGGWDQPKFAREPTQPWFDSAHSNGELVIWKASGSQDTFDWHT
jgi:hypothetical protein